jgi:multiple sugar transport system permease protein
MVDTYAGLIIPFLAWPFGIFLIRQFTQTLPNELFEAAKIDGCPEIYLFLKIAIPLVKPGMICLAVFAFRESWNDYFWQLITLKSTSMKTLPLGVIGLLDEYLIDYGLLMAGSTLASLPIIIIFLVFQKYFTAGITLGAVKA